MTDEVITPIECPECGYGAALCNEEGYDGNDDLYFWDYECMNCHHEWTETQPGDES